MAYARSNPKALETISIRLATLQKINAKVGWFESSHYPDGTPVAYVVMVQEFGWGPIPPRLGMRTTAAAKKTEWAATSALASKRVLDGKMTPMQAMDLLAIKAEGDVAKHIATVTQPPLSPFTLAARKRRQLGGIVTGATLGEFGARQKAGTLDTSGVSTKPLVDSALMINTLTHITESR